MKLTLTFTNITAVAAGVVTATESSLKISK